ncbi:hypothetical protein MMC09_005639 [Bachmanniomyces sp. S44760]|nr:hypothetical protein [Bachmanniomyces sp. S44760]
MEATNHEFSDAIVESKARIKQLLRHTAETTDIPDAFNDQTDDAVRVDNSLDSDKGRLRTELEQKNAEYGALVAAHELLKSKYRLLKDRLKAWQEYHAEYDTRRKQRIIRDKDTDLRSRSLGTNDRPAEHLPKAQEEQVLIRSSEGSDSKSLSNVISCNAQSMSGRASSASRQIPATTKDTGLSADTSLSLRQDSQLAPEINPQPAAKEEEEEDLPVFVSERSLKRKRNDPKRDRTVSIHKDAIWGGNVASVAACTKNEDGSSSPLYIGGVQACIASHDSIDLNEVGERTLTPQKKRRLREFFTASLAQELSDGNRTDASPSRLHIGRIRSGIQGQDAYIRRYEATDGQIAKSALQLRHNERVLERNTGEAFSPALNPRTPNANVLPWTSHLASVKKRSPKQNDSEQIRFQRIAEDGEVISPYSKGIAGASICDAARSTFNTKPVTPIAESEVQGRLGTLLARAPPKEPAIALYQGEDSASVSAAHIHRPKRQTPNVFESGVSSTCLAQGYMRHGHWFSDHPGPSTVGKIIEEPAPLRERSRDLLRLDDFKINAQANQGLNETFKETVRNHDQRKRLSACTRPACCGHDFRRLIELGGDPVPRKASIWDSSPLSGQEEDLKLLEEYSGYSRSCLNCMIPAQRQELLLQARAEQLANTFGKHRQQHERRSTPPGFWRSEMPTTQEEELDKELANEIDAKKVQERHKEALKQGGRWIFRDE